METKEKIDLSLAKGDALLVLLSQAGDVLQSAYSWNSFDFIGGSLMSTIEKHKIVDEAQAYLHEAKELLEEYETHYNALSDLTTLTLDTSNLLTMADFTLDGVVADMLVQAYINDIVAQIGEAIATIETKQNELRGSLSCK